MSTTSSTNVNRITGLATGLDVDALVKASMKPYSVKVDQTKQKKDILEIKQKLYRDVINSGRELYNKYLDVAKGDNLLKSSNYSTIKFESKDNTAVTATATATAVKDNYAVEVTSRATVAKGTFTDAQLFSNLGLPDGDIVISYNGSIDPITIPASKFTAAMTDKERAAVINTEISKIGLKASTSDFSSGIIIESIATGATIGGKTNDFTVTVGTAGALTSSQGTNLKATVTSSRGTITYGDVLDVNDVTKKISGSNNITVDGVSFKITDETTTPVKVIGTTDVTAVKDKIIGFVKDYNAYMEKLNKLVMDRHVRSYNPLTADQKKDMSESEIKLWNEKVETGQLGNDSDVSRIVNNLKSSMSSLVAGSGAVLEKIGIKPVNDYQTAKKGTFILDESILATALEENPEKVMNLFIQPEPTSNTLSKEEKFAQTGVFNRIKDLLYNEVVSSTLAPLILKAGLDSSFSQSTLVKDMSDYTTKITKMEKDLATREQGFYSKYARLEAAMNKLNSQQSYLASQFSTSS